MGFRRAWGLPFGRAGDRGRDLGAHTGSPCGRTVDDCRYSANLQVAIDADSRFVVATGDQRLGNRNDCAVYGESGIDRKLAGRAVIADDGSQSNTGVLMPYRKRSGVELVGVCMNSQLEQVNRPGSIVLDELLTRFVMDGVAVGFCGRTGEPTFILGTYRWLLHRDVIRFDGMDRGVCARVLVTGSDVFALNTARLCRNSPPLCPSERGHEVTASQPNSGSTRSPTASDGRCTGKQETDKEEKEKDR